MCICLSTLALQTDPTPMLLQEQWGVSSLTEAFERANKSQPRHEIVTNKDQRKLKACETTEESETVYAIIHTTAVQHAGYRG